MYKQWRTLHYMILKLYIILNVDSLKLFISYAFDNNEILALKSIFLTLDNHLIK